MDNYRPYAFFVWGGWHTSWEYGILGVKKGGIWEIGRLGYGILGVKKVGYGRLGVKKVGIWEIGGNTTWDMGYLVPCVTPLLFVLYIWNLINNSNIYNVTLTLVSITSKYML